MDRNTLECIIGVYDQFGNGAEMSVTSVTDSDPLYKSRITYKNKKRQGRDPFPMATQKIVTRDFVLSFLSQFTFSLVFFILIPTIPIYLSRRGATEVEIGLLVGVSSVSSLLLRPFVGRALLRITEKKFMIAGALLFTLSSLAYIVSPPFFPFFTVRIFQGVSIALFVTASFTLVANISPEAHRGQSLSYFYLSINIAFALAPAFGMFLINQFGFTTLFLVCTGLSLCTLLIIDKLKERPIDPLQDRSLKDEPFLNREAIPPAIIASIVNIIWGALTAFFPLYALSHEVSNPGLFFTTFALMLILGRGLGGKILDTYSREKVILPCLMTYIVSMGILAFSTTLPMFILVAVIWGLGNAFLYPTLVVYAIDRSAPSLGPAMGTFTALADLGAGMGSMIMGIILHWTSYPVMFLCLAFTGVVNLLYFHFSIRKGGKRYADL